VKITISQLRKLIREAVADTMMAHTEAPPPSIKQQVTGDHPALRDTSNNKANAVAKIVNQKIGNTSLTQKVQQFVAALSPEDKLVMTADEIAQNFLQSRNNP
jgi:hypothetical protein